MKNEQEEKPTMTGPTKTMKFTYTSDVPIEVPVAFFGFLNGCRESAETLMALNLKNQELRLKIGELELQAGLKNHSQSGVTSKKP